MLTLAWRALESRRPDGLFRDALAERVAERLRCDATVAGRNHVLRVGVAIRTEILDELTLRFLARHPDALIVNLGAGFCTRFRRVDNGTARWVEIDLPRVIALRQALIPEPPRCRYVAASVLDDDWPAMLDWTPGRPMLLIAEGLFQYFDATAVRTTITDLSRRLPGAEMLLETVSPLARVLGSRHAVFRRSGVRFRWSVGDVAQLERWTPRLRVRGQWTYDRHPERWGVLRALGWVPCVRNLMKIVDVEFSA